MRKQARIIGPSEAMNYGSCTVEQEYFNLLKQELEKNSKQVLLNCANCQRTCEQSPEETVECLANLLTIEYLLDHN